jgi:hypothetical protein
MQSWSMRTTKPPFVTKLASYTLNQCFMPSIPRLMQCKLFVEDDKSFEKPVSSEELSTPSDYARHHCDSVAFSKVVYS